MIDCMYNKCMYIWRGKKTECKCFSVKNNGLKRYLEMCYSVSCKKNSIQRPSILYEREKIIQYFQTCRFLWRYAWIFFIIHCIIHTGITTWKLVFGVYIYNHRYLLNSWPKNMLLSEHMNTIYHMYHVHHILPIFWYDRNICNYTCKYCTGLWISWYKGEMKWGKKNTAIVY